MFSEIFARKTPSADKLRASGFEPVGRDFVRSFEIMDGAFRLYVTVDHIGNIGTSITECDSGEEYTLYKTTAQGVYIAKVRDAISQVLRTVSDECFDDAVFKSPQTLRLLVHAAESYGTKPEFLWKSTPNNAILRRYDSEKWYAAILTLPESKLGLDSERTVEIINLHAEPERVTELLNRPGFYPAWHMNKKSWFTLIADGSVADETLYELLEVSYNLASKRKEK